MKEYCKNLDAHYRTAWKNIPVVHRWDKGPFWELPVNFCVLEFPQTKGRTMWTYATCCMSQPEDEERVELHLFSPISCVDHVELLTLVAHYHRTGARLALGHTVNFGRPWLDESQCEYGLISLPYLDGPTLERIDGHDGAVVHFLWLIPITKAERDFKKAYGMEALERKFEEQQFNYLDPHRPSVV